MPRLAARRHVAPDAVARHFLARRGISSYLLPIALELFGYELAIRSACLAHLGAAMR